MHEKQKVVQNRKGLTTPRKMEESLKTGGDKKEMHVSNILHTRKNALP